MTYAIETQGLGKTYGNLSAVSELTLKVKEGEIYAFLGLNGAGKTTTIRMLLGMIHPTAGIATMLGKQIKLGNTEPWASVGYLVETTHAYPELTVAENLEVARRLHPGVDKAAIRNVVDLLSLGEYTNRKTGTLSLGNAQRLGLAKAFLHKPSVLILDEPANGLDPAGIVEVREILRQFASEDGVTIFMSSHILGEVSRLADRVGIIQQGKLIQELDLDSLEKNRKRSLKIQVQDIENSVAVLHEAGFNVNKMPHDWLSLHDALSVEHPETITVLLVNAGLPPLQIIVNEEDLEDYFLRLVSLSKGGGND